MKNLQGILQSIRADAQNITLSGFTQADPEKPVRITVSEAKPWDPYSITAITIVDGSPGEFTISIPRFAGKRDRLYQRFHLGLSQDGSQAVSCTGVCFVTEFSGSLVDYAYPSSKTIKGLQVHMVDDALRLGVGHAALNLNQGTIMRSGAAADHIPFEMDGELYYFDRAYLEKFDQRVKTLSDHGIVVTLILLNAINWDGITIDPALHDILVHPSYTPEGEFVAISAFNMTNEAGLRYYKAFIEFVAARYTRPDQAHGRACGFIIGNEVDSQWMWGNAGEMPVAQYVREYSLALRMAFFAVRKYYAQARVYISLDHLWTKAFNRRSLRYYKGRDILTGLNAIYTNEGNFDWSLAYHPYPEDLFHPDFWHDKTATRSFDTKRITFKNLEILSQYMSQSQFLFQGRLRHIILSEQGFHSDENPESERLQAAAYAFAYWKVAHTPGIESFILHAHVDNRDEFNLNLGLWRRDKTSPLPSAPGSPKPVYEVFKGIDGPEGEQFFAEAKQVVGKRFWK